MARRPDGITQQIVFGEQQNVTTQGFVYVTFIIAGAHFDFALGKLCHPIGEGAMIGREERSCVDEAIHFGHPLSLWERG